MLKLLFPVCDMHSQQQRLHSGQLRTPFFLYTNIQKLISFETSSNHFNYVKLDWICVNSNVLMSLFIIGTIIIITVIMIMVIIILLLLLLYYYFIITVLACSPLRNHMKDRTQVGESDSLYSGALCSAVFVWDPAWSTHAELEAGLPD